MSRIKDRDTAAEADTSAMPDASRQLDAEKVLPPQLLARLQSGERVHLFLNGKPFATLVPSGRYFLLSRLEEEHVHRSAARARRESAREPDSPWDKIKVRLLRAKGAVQGQVYKIRRA